jgi:predicted aconitase
MAFTTQQIDDLLNRLNDAATDVDVELGLPLFSKQETERLRNIVSDWARACETSAAVSAHKHTWTNDDGSAICACGERADAWFCPDSPDHLCSYENGDSDACDFCGEPEERK